MSEEMQKQIAYNVQEEVTNMLNAEGEELEKYKKKIIEYTEKRNDKSLLKIINPHLKFKKKLNEFFNSSGYYDVFIPNMKILSSKYKEYHDKVTKLNEKLTKELGLMYDENMKIVRVSE